MSVDNQAVFDSLSSKFEMDVIGVIHHETKTGRLTDSGGARLNLRATIESIVHSAEISLNELFLLKLSLDMAYRLKSLNEFMLAAEIFTMIIQRDAKRVPSENDLAMLIGKLESVIGEVECDFAQSSASPQTRSAPMSVSRHLRCIQRVRSCLDELVQLTAKQQEDLAWLVLNCCKCIIEIGQPLIWTSCGKYVVASMLFSVTCMEGVINLCTWRHWNFRMKIYSSAFYGALVQLGTKQAQNILIRLKKQFAEFLDRELLDKPVPERVEVVLFQIEIDISVMARVLSFWKDPESFTVEVSSAPEAVNASTVGDQPPAASRAVSPGAQSVLATRAFADRCLCECARIQQLTSGNPNEMWKKRSTSIVKVFWSIFSSINVDLYDAFIVQADSEAGSGPEKPIISLECLSGITVMCMFGIVDDLPILDILAKIWLILNKFIGSAEPIVLHPDLDIDCLADMRLLKALADVIDASKLVEIDGSSITSSTAISANIIDSSLLQTLIETLCALMYSEEGTRRRSLLHRVSVSIWTKFVYSRLQSALSASDSSSFAAVQKSLDAMSTPLLHIVQALDFSFIEDPVFLASLAALAATVLHHVGDLRGSISLLKRALEAVDNHRALRVEVSMHLPEDARDVAACQRASLSVGRDFLDWFHGVKRLGAHAFAGFGVFGAGSSADPSDLALADIHADLAALYFRYELEYGIHIYRVRRAFKSASAAAEAAQHSASLAATGSAKKSTKPSTAKIQTSGATKTTTPTKGNEATIGGISGEESSNINAEKLPCVQTLRSYCCKNNYLRCILLLEMALIDTDEKRRDALITDAKDCILEAETREAALVEAFNDLSLVLDSGPAHAPIVLARSHRQIFVVPVASRKHFSHNPPVHYFRVLAKEQGSGTDISLNSDYIAGTEIKVLAATLVNPSAGAVCIQPLRPGERYVFGCAGFTIENDLIGHLSPTSIAVEAVNPLPTIVLWGFLNRVAFSLQSFQLARYAANRISNQYFDKSPSAALTSVGKGINVFIDEEPLLCMLSIEKSTPSCLEAFVSSFLSLEESLKTPPSGGPKPARSSTAVSIHWDMRRETQMHLICSVRKTAAVATIASTLTSHELIARVVCLGYNLLAELMNYDEMHLANYVLYPTLVFIVSLQFIPKRNWHSLEHALYCRLIIHAVKLSMFAKNTSPVAVLLAKIYSEAKIEPENHLPVDVESDYSFLLQQIRVCNRVLVAGATVSSVEADLLELLTHTSKRSQDTMLSSDYLWKRVNVGRRPAFAYSLGSALSIFESSSSTTSPALMLHRMLKERPEAMSDLLSIVACLCQELVAIGESDKIIPLLNRVSIFDKLLAPSVQRLIEDWKLKFVLVMPSPEEQAAQAIAAAEQAEAAASGAKGGKKPPPPAKGAVAPPIDAPPIITADQFAIPAKFTEAPTEEILLQLRGLADIVSALATNFRDLRERVHFPRLNDGPLRILDPSTLGALSLADECFHCLEEYEANPVPVVSPRTQAALDAEAAAKAAAAAAPPAKGKGAAKDEPVALPIPMNVPLDLVATKQSFVKHISMAISLYTRARCPAAAIGASVTLWNYIVESWQDPVGFAKDFLPVRQLFHQALFSLVQQFEVLIGIVPALTPNNGLESAVSIAAPTSAAVMTTRTLKEHLLVVKDLVLYLVKVLWLYKQYKDVVDVASRLIEVFITVAPEYSKTLGIQFFPLMIHAQEQIIRVASELLASRKQTVVQFVNDFEEAMKKKRRKKLRIARLEKDEDELAFEAERDVLQGYVNEAESDLQFNENRLAGIENQQKIFLAQYPTGVQLLDRVRVVSRTIVSDATDQLVEDDHNDLRLVLSRSRELVARLDDCMEQFTNVGHFLREKKDRLTLIETLKEQADLLLIFGRIPQAKLIWIDIVDGFFNVMDSIQNWTSVTRDALDTFDPALMSGVLPVIVALGKLSRYCAARDWDWKSTCARMASAVGLLPFKESFGHPQSLVGLSAYDCRELGGVASFAFNADKLTADGLCLAINELVAVLHEEQLYLEQLSLLVLLEHFHGAYTRLPNAWMSARLKRVRCLECAGMFGEAGAMLAGIIPTIQAIQTRTFHRPLQAPNKLTTAAEFDTSTNGLDYHGSAPYFNHLPPNHELNSKAMSWIESLPSKFATFCAPFVINLPVRELSPEEVASRKAAKEEAAALAAAAAAKDKKASKKAPAEVAPVADDQDDQPTAPLFDGKVQAELALVCAMFLLQLSKQDFRTTLPHSSSLIGIGTKGLGLIDQVLAILGTIINDKLKSDPGQQGIPDSSSALNPTVEAIRGDAGWMSLYCQAKILRARHLVGCRQFKEVKAMIFSLLQVLSGFLPTKNPNVYYPPDAVIKPLDLVFTPLAPRSLSAQMQFVVAQAWSSAKEVLVDIAERQSRTKDVIAMATQNAKDSSALMSSYWLRAALFARAKANLKSGNLAECEFDCNAVIQSFEATSSESILFVRFLCLKASLIREQIVSTNSPAAADNLKTALSLARRARWLAEKLARRSGFLGADSNITFFRSSSAELQFERLPSLLHNISEIHCNEPELTLPPVINQKLFSEVLPSSVKPRDLPAVVGRNDTRLETCLITPLDDDPDTPWIKPWNGRLGPVDATESTITESEFGNIYLPAVRVLASSHAALATILLECRGCNATVEPKGHGSGTSTGKRPTTARLQQVLEARAQKYQRFEKVRLTEELVSVSEDGLKLLRHIVFPSAQVRLSLLLAAGSTRKHSTSMRGSDPFIARQNDPELNISEYIISPLRTNVELGVFGSQHPWQTMRAASVELVDLFGDSSVPIPIAPDSRLKLATMYLITAIKLSGQDLLVKENILKLMDSSPALVSSASKDIADILLAFSSSSAPTADESANSAPAGGKGAKGKGPAAAAVPGGVGPSGRDALFMLASVQRECDILWKDSYEFDVWCDLHNLLKKEFEPYKSKCVLGGVPDPSAQLTITVSSVSALFNPTKAPVDFVDPADPPTECGLYSHLLVYFLLGPKQVQVAQPVVPVVDPKAKGKPAAAASATPAVEAIGDPVLTKVVLFRPHVASLELTFRKIRESLREATAKDWPHVIATCASRLGDALVQLASLLKRGYIEPKQLVAPTVDPTATLAMTSRVDCEPRLSNSGSIGAQAQDFEVLPASEARAYLVVKFTAFESGEPCLVPLTDECLGKLADMNTYARDVDAILDNDVCTFYRSALGYTDN